MTPGWKSPLGRRRRMPETTAWICCGPSFSSRRPPRPPLLPPPPPPPPPVFVLPNQSLAASTMPIAVGGGSADPRTFMPCICLSRRCLSWCRFRTWAWLSRTCSFMVATSCSMSYTLRLQSWLLANSLASCSLARASSSRSCSFVWGIEDLLLSAWLPNRCSTAPRRTDSCSAFFCGRSPSDPPRLPVIAETPCRLLAASAVRRSQGAEGRRRAQDLDQRPDRLLVLCSLFSFSLQLVGQQCMLSLQVAQGGEEILDLAVEVFAVGLVVVGTGDTGGGIRFGAGPAVEGRRWVIGRPRVS